MDEQEQKDLPVEQKVLYACPEFPSYTIHVTPNDTLQAVNGLLEVPLHLVAAMAKLAKRPDVRAVLRKIDVKAGADIVAADIAKRRAAAVQGPMTTDNSALNEMRKVAQEQKELKAAGQTSDAGGKAAEPTGVQSDPNQKQPGADAKPLSLIERMKADAAKKTS